MSDEMPNGVHRVRSNINEYGTRMGSAMDSLRLGPLLNENSKEYKEYVKQNKELMEVRQDFIDTLEGLDKRTNEFQEKLAETVSEFREKVWDAKEKDAKDRYEREHITDNKQTKESNLQKATQDYYEELNKLSEEAYIKFGEDFAHNEEYLKELQELNNQHYNNILDAKKEDEESRKEQWDENHKFLAGFRDEMKDVLSDNSDTLLGALGPLNLIMKPFQDFFGKGFIKKIVSNVNLKKKKPTVNDVLKIGAQGTGFLYLADVLEDKLGNGLADSKQGFLDNLLGGDIAEQAKSLLGGKLSSAGLVASTAMMVYDGVKAVFKADEWGVGKGEAFVGGLLGGTGEGWSNAFKKSGQMALFGASAGAKIGGPMGALIGGVAGGLVGGIGGYFGGEKIAQWIHDIFECFNLKELFSGIKDVWKNEQLNFFGKLGMSFNEMFTWFAEGAHDKKTKGLQRSVQTQVEKGKMTQGQGDWIQFATDNKIITSGKIGDKENINGLQYIYSHSRDMSSDMISNANEWYNSDVNVLDLARVYGGLGYIFGTDNEWKEYFNLNDYKSTANFIAALLNNYTKAGGIDFKSLLEPSDLLSMQRFVSVYDGNSESSQKVVDKLITKHNKSADKKNYFKIEDGIVPAPKYNYGRTISGINETVSTDVNDSIIATKNPITVIPSKLLNQSLSDITNTTNNYSTSSVKSKDYSKELKTIIEVLGNLLNKETVVVNQQSNRNDLVAMINGIL